MRAIGHNGQCREWGELTAEEQREWLEAMNAADRHIDARKRGEFASTLTVAQTLARNALNKRFVY